MGMSELEAAWMMLYDAFGIGGAAEPATIAAVILALLLSILAGSAAGKFLLWLPGGILGLLSYLGKTLGNALGSLFWRAKDERRKPRREQDSAKFYPPTFCSGQKGAPFSAGKSESWRKSQKDFVSTRPRTQLEKKEESEAEGDEQEESDLEEEPAREEQQEKPKPLDKSMYLERELSKAQRENLLARGYKRLKTSAFGDSGASYYLVDKRWNEGALHAFFCYLIEDELKKKGKKPELHINDGPDIVFEHKGHRYCFDVETGTNLARSREKVERKFGYYARDYYRSYIFVTKKKFKHKYRRYGIVVTRASLRKALSGIFR